MQVALRLLRRTKARRAITRHLKIQKARQSTSTELINFKNWGRNVQKNYTANLLHVEKPTTLGDLATFLNNLPGGQKVRVRGQTHAQTPLIVTEEPENVALVDLSGLRSVNGKFFEISDDEKTVEVSAGMREADLSHELGLYGLSLKTVTAGGFFSVGGVTSVDVHGAALDSGIFASNLTEIKVMRVGESLPSEIPQDKMEFGKVNLGAFGVVTSLTLECVPNTGIGGGIYEFNAETKDSFAMEMLALLENPNVERLEVFFNPYRGNYLCGFWNLQGVVSIDCPPQQDVTPKQGEEENDLGADALEQLQSVYEAKQYSRNEASLATNTAMIASKGWMETAICNGKELWLTDEKIVRAMFMSYFIPIDEGEEGMNLAWEAMNVVKNRLDAQDAFNLVAPMEFRFVRGDTSVMSGAYSRLGADQLFLNLDLIGYLRLTGEESPDHVDYDPNLMDFFGRVEQAWYHECGGLPHQGKMFGFYNPDSATFEAAPAPFDDRFLTTLYGDRSDRVDEFRTYRDEVDENRIFSNAFVDKLLGATPQVSV